MAAVSKLENVFNLIFKGVSPELFPKELQESLLSTLSKSASPEQMADDIARWRRSVLENTDETTRLSDNVIEFLKEGSTVARLSAIPKVHDVASRFNALLTSNVDSIDVSRLLDDALRGKNSPLPDEDIKAIEDVFKESIKVRESTIKSIMEDFNVTREQALDGYARQMAKKDADGNATPNANSADGADADGAGAGAADGAADGAGAKVTEKTIDEIKVIKKLSDDFDRRVAEFLDDPETKKLKESAFEEQVETLIRRFNKDNEDLLKKLGEDGNEQLRAKVSGTSDRIFKFYEENIRPRGIKAAISEIKESLKIFESRKGKISPTNVNGDFPEFNLGVDWGKVKRHIGMFDIDKTILPVPRWWFYPVKAMITRSEGITKPIVQYVDKKLSSLNITDSIRQLNEDVLETVRNGKNPEEIIENFAKENGAALEEFSENMRQLKMHIEASYKTNKELTGSDKARWTYDLTEEQKATLLKYVEDMENIAIDLKAGMSGKNAHEMLESLKKIEGGESGYTYMDYKKSVTGLSRAAEIANFSIMRTTGKWLDGSGRAKGHYLRKIERGIDVGYYSNSPRGGKPIHLSELKEENIEKAWQDFLAKFTDVDEQGHTFLNLEKDVKPIEAMITNFTTIAGPALEEYAVISAKQLSRITQRSLRGDGIDPFPDDTNFLTAAKRMPHSGYFGDARSKDMLDKVADVFKEATEAKRGAPDENLFGIKERFIDDNRWTRSLAMDRSYRFWEPYEMFDNPNSFLGRLGVGYPSALQLKGFFQHTLFKGPLTFMTGGRVEMANQRSLIDNFKSFYGRKHIWKEEGESFTAPLKRAALRWGSGFTVKDTNGAYNPFKWDWNKKVAVPTAAAGGIYAADYMTDEKYNLDEYGDALLWFNPYKLGYEAYQFGNGAYDYVDNKVNYLFGDDLPSSSTANTADDAPSVAGNYDDGSDATPFVASETQSAAGSDSGVMSPPVADTPNNNNAGGGGDTVAPAAGERQSAAGGNASGANTATAATATDTTTDGSDVEQQQKVDNRPQWQKDLDESRAEAARLVAQSYAAAVDIELYLSNNSEKNLGARDILEAINRQEADIIQLQKELREEGRTAKANNLGAVLKDVRFAKSDAEVYLLKLNDLNEDTQRLRKEIEEINKQIKAIDNFNDAMNATPELLAQLRDKAKEIKENKIEAEQLRESIRQIAIGNAERMNLNEDIRYRYGTAHQLDESLKKLGGGEYGLPYQWFGKGQSGVSSVAGGLLETAFNSVKGVGEWWGDVKRSARTQGERNMYNAIEAGVGIFASIGLFNFINEKLFDNKINGIAKWGIIIGIVGAFMYRSGGVGQAMANNSDRFSPFFLQSDNSSYSARARTTGQHGNGHIPTSSSFNADNGGNGNGNGNGRESTLVAQIRDRNGNAVDHIIYVDGRMTTQSHNGGLPKTANDIVVSDMAAEKINSAVQQDLDRIKGAMSGKGTHLPNPLKGEIDVVINSEGAPPQKVTIDYTVSDPETADLTRPR